MKWGDLEICAQLCSRFSNDRGDLVEALRELPEFLAARIKKYFVFAEFSGFNVVAFRTPEKCWKLAPIGSGQPLADQAFSESLLLDWKQKAEAASDQASKPLYLTGHSLSGILAIAAAKQFECSEVVTFGLPEATCLKAMVERPRYRIDQVISIQNVSDPVAMADQHESFGNRRIWLPEHSSPNSTGNTDLDKIRKAIAELCEDAIEADVLRCAPAMSEHRAERYAELVESDQRDSISQQPIAFAQPTPRPVAKNLLETQSNQFDS